MTTAAHPTSTIKLLGKDFKVTVNGTDQDGRTRYKFEGRRGACYGTMRNQKNPDLIFLINLRGFGMAPGFEHTFLTDKNGALECVDVVWL